MDPPTSFSSLPPELVTQICHDSVLEKEDLVALRLTSKSQGIHLSASKEFAKRSFTEVRLVYTRYSLQTFEEICRHPIFGFAVRIVRLSYARFLPDCFEEESKSLFEWSGMSSQGRHEYLDNIRLLVNRCDEEEDLGESGDAKGLLAAAFTALSHWRHPLQLGVSSDESRAKGRDRIYSPSNTGENACWQCDILGTVALLCQAAISSGCVVQNLRIEGAVCNNLIDSSTHSLNALAQLPELMLDICAPEFVDIADVEGLEDMVIKLLENAVGLKILDLDCSCSGSYMRLDKVLSEMPTNKLEKLILTYVNLDWLEPFEERIKTLRHLEMYDCGIEGGLKDVLLSIQRNFSQLEYFLFYGMDKSGTNRKVEFEGVREVNDGINKLIQSEA